MSVHINVSKLNIENSFYRQPIDRDLLKLIKFAIVEHKEDGCIEIISCLTKTSMTLYTSDIRLLIDGLKGCLDG